MKRFSAPNCKLFWLQKKSGVVYISIVYHHLWNKKLFQQHLLVFVVFAAKWFNIKIYSSQSRVLDIKQALTMSNKNNNHFFCFNPAKVVVIYWTDFSVRPLKYTLLVVLLCRESFCRRRQQGQFLIAPLLHYALDC